MRIILIIFYAVLAISTLIELGLYMFTAWVPDRLLIASSLLASCAFFFGAFVNSLTKDQQ